MKRSVFKYIESELFCYPDTLKEIELIREEIMTGSGEQSNIRVQTNRTSDPTARTTTRLLTDRRLRRLEEVRNAIQGVFDKLPAEQKTLVQLKYWEQRLTHKGIAEELHISEMSFYRWRRQIVEAIAEQLGMLKL